LLAAKLPSIGIEAKEIIRTTTRRATSTISALRIRSSAPDIVMMSNYQNEYVLLARTLYQQKVNVAGFFSMLGGGFNYKFAKEQPDVSQYMMD
jgi:branched-chain amino acid transport system substrate-binding protein